MPIDTTSGISEQQMHDDHQDKLTEVDDVLVNQISAISDANPSWWSEDTLNIRLDVPPVEAGGGAVPRNREGWHWGNLLS